MRFYFVTFPSKEVLAEKQKRGRERDNDNSNNNNNINNSMFIYCLTFNLFRGYCEDVYVSDAMHAAE